MAIIALSAPGHPIGKQANRQGKGIGFIPDPQHPEIVIHQIGLTARSVGDYQRGVELTPGQGTAIDSPHAKGLPLRKRQASFQPREGSVKFFR